MNVSDRTMNAAQAKVFSYQQDENESLTYTINWAAVLNGNTIVSSEWTVNNTNTSPGAFTDTQAAIEVNASGGRYLITNTIEASTGETMQRTLRLEVLSAASVTGDYE